MKLLRKRTDVVAKRQSIRSALKRRLSVKADYKDLQTTLIEDLAKIFEQKSVFNNKEGIEPSEYAEVSGTKSTGYNVYTYGNVDSVFFHTSGDNVNYYKASNVIDDWIENMEKMVERDLDAKDPNYEEKVLDYMHEEDNNHGYYIQLEAEVNPATEHKSDVFTKDLPVYYRKGEEDVEKCEITFNMWLRTDSDPNYRLAFPKDHLIVRRKKGTNEYMFGYKKTRSYDPYWDLYDFVTQYTNYV